MYMHAHACTLIKINFNVHVRAMDFIVDCNSVNQATNDIWITLYLYNIYYNTLNKHQNHQDWRILNRFKHRIVLVHMTKPQNPWKFSPLESFPLYSSISTIIYIYIRNKYGNNYDNATDIFLLLRQQKSNVPCMRIKFLALIIKSGVIFMKQSWKFLKIFCVLVVYSDWPISVRISIERWE